MTSKSINFVPKGMIFFVLFNVTYIFQGVSVLLYSSICPGHRLLLFMLLRMNMEGTNILSNEFHNFQINAQQWYSWVRGPLLIIFSQSGLWVVLCKEGLRIWFYLGSAVLSTTRVTLAVLRRLWAAPHNARRPHHTRIQTKVDQFKLPPNASTVRSALWTCFSSLLEAKNKICCFLSPNVYFLPDRHLPSPWLSFCYIPGPVTLHVPQFLLPYGSIARME